MTTSGAAVVRPRLRPRADRTLICLSFCGGGTTSFRPWADALPDDVELAVICYPGREGRYATPFATTWEDLQEDVTAAVSTLIDRPYVLLGHSMGAWVAFDLAARMAAAGLRPPSMLVVSASDSPTRWEARRARKPRLADTDESLLHWMRTVGQLSALVLAEPDLRDMAVEVLRADIAVSDTYRYRPGTRLDVPVQVLYGVDDVDVGAEAAARWQELTSGSCRVDGLAGGHFYTPEIWSRLPEHLASFGLAHPGPVRVDRDTRPAATSRH